MNAKNLTASRTVIVFSWFVAVLSLFLTWVDAYFFKANGFQQEGYFLLAYFLYPLAVVLSKKKMNKVIGYISSGCGFLTITYFISTKSMEAFGESMNFASVGMYVFLAATIVLMVGVYLSKGSSEEEVKPKEETEQEVLVGKTETQEKMGMPVLYGPKQFKEIEGTERHESSENKIEETKAEKQ